MRYDLNDKRLRQLFEKGEFGIEMESLRVTKNGELAKTPHPFDNDPNITRDFCENQTEMITDVFDSIDGALDQLFELQKKVRGTLCEDGELLWRSSNPPAFSDPDEIPIADFKGSVYRDYLASKYGKVKMLLSGIHLNFSLPAETIDELSERQGTSARDTKDALYLDLAAKLLSYSWLIVYLTAASPVLDESFARFGGVKPEDIDKYASVRCSEAGYWNFFTPSFDFSSLESYARSIERYIESGDIISCSELYYPIRVKPRGKYGTDTLRENGINHIELRMIDLDPLSDIGIFKEDIEFIHLLIIYLLCRDIPLPDRDAQETAVHNMKQAALMSTDTTVTLHGGEVNIKEAALSELDKLLAFAQQYYPHLAPAVKLQISKAGSHRYADILRGICESDYMKAGLHLAKLYRGSDENVHALCGERKG